MEPNDLLAKLALPTLTTFSLLNSRVNHIYSVEKFEEIRSPTQ